PAAGGGDHGGGEAGDRHDRGAPAAGLVSLDVDASSGPGTGGEVPPIAVSASRRRGSRGRSRRSFRRVIRTRLTRRGSASRTSNSNRPGPGTISPRTGRRPARVTR